MKELREMVSGSRLFVISYTTLLRMISDQASFPLAQSILHGPLHEQFNSYLSSPREFNDQITCLIIAKTGRIQL
ncbi:hypothetical protein P8452_02936 [Trifolium repens]|nr:hypothetical protein P8452_02936 [Trifolium repens]